MLTNSQVQLSPIVDWALRHQADLPAWETRLRATLRSHGIGAKHWRGMNALTVEANAWLVSQLNDPLEKEKLLRALEILGRSQMPEVDAIRFSELADLLDELQSTEISLDTLVRLVRGWLDSSDEIDVLREVISWGASTGRTRTPSGGWNTLIRKVTRNYAWASPTALPEIRGITVTELDNGEALLAEGKQMDNCLAGRLAFDYARRAAEGNALHFHLARTRNPIVCATLALERSKSGRWRIDEFSTVGGGNPPAILQAAAKTLQDTLDRHEGLDPLDDDSEDFLDGD